MNSNDCGCGSPTNNSGEYLLVKATASEASTCGTADSSGNQENCAKTEPLFDYSLSDFLVPSENSSTSMQVCNASIYSVGMWIQTLGPVATMKISNITGKVLTLINRCSNGDPVSSNPDVGQVISKNTKFIVCEEPPCNTSEEDLEQITNAFRTAKEICTPELEESTSTQTIQPVGRVQSDSSNLSIGKCIKRIKGILFYNGSPILNLLSRVNNRDGFYRRLAKDKITNIVYEVDNYSEDANMQAVGGQCVLAVTNSKEIPIGPTYIPIMIGGAFIAENTPGYAPGSQWPVAANSQTYTYNLQSIAPTQVNFLSLQVGYWAQIRMELGAYSDNTLPTLIAYLNNNVACRVVKFQGAEGGMVCATVLVFISRSDNLLTLRIDKTSVTSRFYFRLVLDAIYI